MKYEIRHKIGDERGIQLFEDDGEPIAAVFFTIPFCGIYSHPEAKKRISGREGKIIGFIDEIIEKETSGGKGK